MTYNAPILPVCETHWIVSSFRSSCSGGSIHGSSGPLRGTTTPLSSTDVQMVNGYSIQFRSYPLMGLPSLVERTSHPLPMNSFVGLSRKFRPLYIAVGVHLRFQFYNWMICLAIVLLSSKWRKSSLDLLGMARRAKTGFLYISIRNIGMWSVRIFIMHHLFCSQGEES